MKHTITVIGCGRIGTSLRNILMRGGHRVYFWDEKVSRRTRGVTLARICADSDAVFLCVPSGALGAVARSISSYLPTTAVVFSLTKGIDRSGATSDEILKKYFSRFAVVAGPMMAEELARLGGVIMLGTRNAAAAPLAHELFSHTRVAVETTSDVRGAALCGVLKNIYAVGFGMIERAWGWNMKGWYVAHALSEMADIAVLLGAKRETVYSSAGLGDFIATAFSPHSSNVRAGKAIIAHTRWASEEGIVSIAPVLKKLRSRKKRFPLLLTINELIRRA